MGLPAWQSDFEPYVVGVYATFDRATAVELGYAWLYDVDDCATVDPLLEIHPREHGEAAGVADILGFPVFLLYL